MVFKCSYNGNYILSNRLFHGIMCRWIILNYFDTAVRFLCYSSLFTYYLVTWRLLFAIGSVLIKFLTLPLPGEDADAASLIWITPHIVNVQPRSLSTCSTVGHDRATVALQTWHQSDCDKVYWSSNAVLLAASTSPFSHLRWL